MLRPLSAWRDDSVTPAASAERVCHTRSALLAMGVMRCHTSCSRRCDDSVTSAAPSAVGVMIVSHPQRPPPQ
eukprot:297033-Pyramimonas_sp.AAC.1